MAMKKDHSGPSGLTFAEESSDVDDGTELSMWLTKIKTLVVVPL